MKQYFIKIQKAIYSLAITGFLLAVTAPVFANGKKQNTSPVSTTEPTVAFVNTNTSGSTFLVTFDNSSNAKFELSVHNINGNVPFKGIYNDQKFSKYVKLIAEDGNVADYYFTIHILPNGQEHTFTISNKVNVVKNVIIEQL